MDETRRRATSLWGVSVATTVALLLPAPLPAQDRVPVRVTLGFASAPPGRQLTVPLLLEGADGKRIGLVASKVEVPAGILRFVRLERAALLEEQDFDAVAEVRADPPGSPAAATDGASSLAQYVLDVRIAARKADVWLDDGILAYLVFQVEPTAGEKAPEVALRHETRVFSGAVETAAPLAVVTDQTTLVVENPNLPVFACFFYMH